MINDKYYIPKYTDSPEQFLMCTVDEMFIGSGLFLLFASDGYATTGGVVMISVILVIKRVKKSFFKEGLEAFRYWHFPGLSPLDKHLPKSSNREYIG